MTEDIPKGARLAARVILIDGRDRVLFFQAKDPAGDRRFWVMPGGGLDAAETFEEAAVREVLEETGLSVTLGPCVWVRRHRHVWEGRPADQYERFFVAQMPSMVCELDGKQLDSYISGYRWWSLEELTASPEDFAPRRAADLLAPILRGDLPSEPRDCGV